jgi:hypothetical protein
MTSQSDDNDSIELFGKILDKPCGACGGEGQVQKDERFEWRNCARCKGTGYELTGDGKLLWNFIERHAKRLASTLGWSTANDP